MSGGGGVRQRHSQDYPSSDEDSEDDACSKPTSLSPIEQPTTWTRVQDMLWVGSTIFILYLGDFRSNLIHVLLFDGRIKRYAERRPFKKSFDILLISLPLFLKGTLLSRSSLPFLERRSRRLHWISSGIQEEELREARASSVCSTGGSTRPPLLLLDLICLVAHMELLEHSSFDDVARDVCGSLDVPAKMASQATSGGADFAHMTNKDSVLTVGDQGQRWGH